MRYGGLEQRSFQTVSKGWGQMVAESAVARLIERIRSMVLSGELLPGQKVLQKELAEQLGVSRIPVREALAQLHAEGVLDHRANTGFTVGRFDSEDLAEIYLMRRLLETELIRSTDLTTVDLPRMRKLHAKMDSVSPVSQPDEFQRLNQEFHFVLFDASSLKRVRREVARLWYMSAYYRAFYLSVQGRPEGSLQLEHKNILDAIEKNDRKQLIKFSDEHRHWTERMVEDRLGSARRQNYGRLGNGRRSG